MSRVAAIPWHPLLFAAVIVLTAWVDSAISPYAVIRSLAGALALAVSLVAVGTLATRSLQLGGFLATGVIWLLWSKQVVEVTATAFDRLGSFAWLWILAVVAVLGLAVRIAARLIKGMSAASATSLLNRAGFVLVVATLLLGTIRGTIPALVGDLDQGMSLDQWAGSGGDGPSTVEPDIYAILLDGYPRADVLDHAFDVDNNAFIDGLAERGFDVSSLGHSDYIWTHVSVASALNMAYIEQIPRLEAVVDQRVPQQPALRHAVNSNEVFDAVRERGYDAIAVASGFEQVTARQADVLIEGGQLSEFEVSLLASTYAGDLIGLLAPDLASAQQRDRILGNLDVLAEIASTPNRPPALVFAHIPAPHQPVVFGNDGAPVAVPIAPDFYADSPMERGEDPAQFRDRYRNQLPYLNDQILAGIDGVIANSAVPPVIVLFADHGSASRTDWNQTNPYTVDPSIVLERTGILFAAYTPGREDVYPDQVSPVDLFRLLFDAYFDTEHGRATPPDGGGQIAPVDASVLTDQGQSRR